MIRMKRNIYMTIGLCYFAFAFSGCSEKDEQSGNDSGTKIEGIALSMNGSTTEVGVTTRATSEYSVNTKLDPTSTSTGTIAARGTAHWKLDFTLYNVSVDPNGVKYDDGSFTKGVYSSGYWKNDDVPARQLYFPNYKNPKADILLYPDPASSTTYPKDVELDQSNANKLLIQDILFAKRTPVQIAHNIIQSDGNGILLNHQRAMLDFIVSDIVFSDIASVTVKVGSDTYIPYLAKPTAIPSSGIGNLEYLLILPEGTTDGTTVSPVVVKIVTKPSSTTGASAITYTQNVELISSGTLGSNNCYCFTLQGNPLTISPVTITDWTTGKPVTGEYLGVTEYPTFKGAANETWYLYFDNKLTEPDGLGGTKAKLQTITFNNEGECTIKPDGRIITHIFKGSKPTNLSDLSSGILATPIVLNNMYITLP